MIKETTQLVPSVIWGDSCLQGFRITQPACPTIAANLCEAAALSTVTFLSTAMVIVTCFGNAILMAYGLVRWQDCSADVIVDDLVNAFANAA